MYIIYGTMMGVFLLHIWSIARVIRDIAVLFVGLAGRERFCDSSVSQFDDGKLRKLASRVDTRKRKTKILRKESAVDWKLFGQVLVPADWKVRKLKISRRDVVIVGRWLGSRARAILMGGGPGLVEGWRTVEPTDERPLRANNHERNLSDLC